MKKKNVYKKSKIKWLSPLNLEILKRYYRTTIVSVT